LAGASEGRARNVHSMGLLPGIILPPSNMLVCDRITEYDGGISSIWETRKALINRSGHNLA